MAKSRRPKKTTTKKPASMPTLARPSPLEPSTASNVQVPTRDAYEDFTDTASLSSGRPHRTNLGPHNQHLPARSGPSNRMPRDAGQDYTDGAHEPGLLPPPTSIDPLDPRFRAAWQEWTANALGRLDQLPKLTQNQLAAIARAAAAGVGAGAGGQLLQGAGDSNTGALTVPGEGGQQVLGIDLPASLAALFEAKLTLDREKAKLVRMQKELQGYRAVAGRQKEEEEYCHCECHECHHDHDDDDHSHGHEHSQDEGDDYSYEYDFDYCEQGCAHGEHNHPPEDEDAFYDDEDLDVQYDESDPAYAQPQLVQGSATTIQHPVDGIEYMYDGHGLYTQQAWNERQRQQEYYASLPPITDDPERMEATVAQLFDWIKAVVSMHR